MQESGAMHVSAISSYCKMPKVFGVNALHLQKPQVIPEPM